MRRLITTGSKWEKAASYSRAVIDGDWVFVSGCTGFDYATGKISDDVSEQTRQIFRNIIWALEEAGVTLADAVRVRVFLADRADFEAVAAVQGEVFADIRPANTTVIAPLLDPRMKVEIEVTAHRRQDG